ncbi:putative u3 snornp-associated protein utp11 protein [Neofusicoccum parvum UCRNP2]|uniref:U3 small nucleolar RNA-associated protein 11 n=1 Tax=Botryosphaeria parva (strain UCR-NP2) TaxID=1287680 RepID=R1GPH5_BOTPV|nr:putative u3 snornp-associated protein utp11 protein [Neofusicoccum parvum UCRNP2]
MSSMRNAVQRRNHKERAQPLERQKWGLLEKHKDYSLRAKDHNEKRKRLKILREKAADRNPDEFSFGMMSSTVNKRTGTRNGDRGNTALSTDVVKLLKTQDAGYIRTMLQKVRKEREKVEEGFVLDEEEGEIEALKGQSVGKGKHTVFVGDQQEQKEFAPEEWFDVEDEADLERVWNRPRKQAKAQDDDEDLGDTDGRQGRDDEPDAREQRALQRKREKAQEFRRLKLEALKRKERDLMTAQEELEAQRSKMNNNVGGVNKNGVKFKVRERKR